MLVEMHMERGHDVAEVVVLDVVQLLLHIRRMMVEHDRQRAHHLHARRRALVLDERIAHQVAHHFAAVLRQTTASDQLVEAHQKLLGHRHREAHEIIAHDARRLHEVDGDTGSVFRVVLERVFRLVEHGAHIVEQRLHIVELLVRLRKTSIARLVGKRVGPAALQLDVVVDLIDHLGELTRVNTVRAHKQPPSSRRAIGAPRA